MKRATWCRLICSIAGLTSAAIAHAHVNDPLSAIRPEIPLAGTVVNTPHMRTVMDEPTRNVTPEQRDQLRRKMREHWERMSPEERREMEERLREYQAQRFWTPAS